MKYRSVDSTNFQWDYINRDLLYLLLLIQLESVSSVRQYQYSIEVDFQFHCQVAGIEA